MNRLRLTPPRSGETPRTRPGDRDPGASTGTFPGTSARVRDVAIVGGGPAGASAALVLAKRGVDVVVLDRAIFPRDKLCGGLLTLRSRRIFDAVFGPENWDALVEWTAHGARFFAGTEHLASVENGPPLASARRRDFDAGLLNLAERAGAEIRQGIRVGAVNANVPRAAATGRDDEIFARVIIGADGVSSVVARSLFGRAFDRRAIALAVETEIPLSWSRRKNRAIRRPAIHFGVVNWGYGWRFPKRETTTVGIGGLWRKNRDMAGRFRHFLREWYGETPPFPIRGQYLPAGNYRSRPGRDAVLLCGDAAGLVDPITGEGIALAMESGAMAGRAAADALAAGSPETASARYRREYAEIARSLRVANRLRFAVLPPPAQRYLRRKLKGPGAESMIRRHMDLMAGNLDYRTFCLESVRRKLRL